MGLLSNRVDRGSLKPGDHVYSWRAAYIYAHHGIYVGDDKVVHFTRRSQEVGTRSVLDIISFCSGSAWSLVPCPTCTPSEDGNGVVSSCLNCFLAGGDLYRYEYSVTPAIFLADPRGGTCTLAVSDPPNVVVHRANYLINNGFGCFGCYHLFKNNCEDFAIYCKTGLLVADQGTMGPSGQAASIIVGPLVTLLSTFSRFRTINIYGMAAATAATAGMYYVNRYAADFGVRKDVVKVPVEDLTCRLATVLPTVVEPRVPALVPNNNATVLPTVVEPRVPGLLPKNNATGLPTVVEPRVPALVPNNNAS